MPGIDQKPMIKHYILTKGRYFATIDHRVMTTKGYTRKNCAENTRIA